MASPADPNRPYSVLAYDPGAARTGFAVVDEGPVYIVSGVVHTPRPKTEKFQEYRMRLTEKWVGLAKDQLLKYWPDIVVTETVPSRGAGIPEQLYLTSVQITCVHVMAMRYGIPVVQVSARTVQSVIAKRGNSKGITKPQVRNGVIERLPDARLEIKDQVFERSDALAIALWYQGERLNLL